MCVYMCVKHYSSSLIEGTVLYESWFSIQRVKKGGVGFHLPAQQTVSMFRR